MHKGRSQAPQTAGARSKVRVKYGSERVRPSNSLSGSSGVGLNGAVRPLPYHYAITDILERENPKSFSSLRPTRSPGATSGQLDQALLRHAYRLDAQGHPEVHGPVQRAADALGVTVPVEVYADEAGQGNNAELIYVPGRAVLLITGNTLNLLDAAELCAVAGHELAHYVLWSIDDGRFLAASRLLDAASSDARTPSEYLETARRFSLAAELFADRGALAACGSLTATVSGLLKITTGLARVDAQAYLRQAAEVDYSVPSSGSTHPETVLRAWALQQWVQRGAAADDDVATALAPQLDLGSLDLLAQDRLAELTRTLVASLISNEFVRGEDTLELAQHYGVWPAAATPLRIGSAVQALSAESRRYLSAVLLDFATADPDGSSEVLSQAIALGRQAGLGADIERMISAELDLGERVRTRVMARAGDIAAQVAAPEADGTADA